MTIETKKEFKDDGIQISESKKLLKENLPKNRGTLALDPVCLSCTHMQSDIIK